MSQQAPFTVDAVRTAAVIAYRNAEYIADEVLPIVRAPAREFKFLNYPVAETFAIPDTKVGRRSQPNEITLTGTDATGSVLDYGLDDPIPQDDIDQALAQSYDIQGRSAEQLMDYLLLDREKRCADLVFAAATYASGYKVQLAGNDQWNEYAQTASDPIEDVELAIETPLIRPNTLVFGQSPWSYFSRHPKVVKAINGTDGDSGKVRRQQIADLFEVERVLVGRGRFNTAKKGQTASLSRVWGNHFAALHINKQADTRNGVTFGYTAQHNTRIAGGSPDKNIGLRGGVRNRVGWSVKEMVTAQLAGYFIEDAV